MRRRRMVSAVTVLLLAAAGCGGDASQEDGGGGEPLAAKSADPLEQVTELEPFFEGISADDFDTATFDRSTVIDNEWLPLMPGTRLVYEGRAIDDEGRVRRRIEFTVTDLTKVIAGVRTLVVWDRDYNDGELVEAEIAFFAQDNDGNVWHLGQYPEEYEHGQLVGAPGWIADREGAKAGIAMKAEPELGGAPYSQGFAPPPINWDDHARVIETGQETCVPVECYTDVLVTEEFEPEAPGAFQLKYYARGVGNIRVGWAGLFEEERERLVMVAYETLTPEALAQARAEALELDRRAHSVREDVFGGSLPAEPLSDA